MLLCCCLLDCLLNESCVFEIEEQPKSPNDDDDDGHNLVDFTHAFVVVAVAAETMAPYIES